ncbi:hypothetical protein LP420_27880 [Massilia sp. B-10]|nr:hypothetical protein LP420_27880 [Massilia sp. B-10]
MVGQGLSGTIDLQTVRPLSFGKRTVAMNVRGERNSLGNIANEKSHRQPRQLLLHRPVPRPHPGRGDRFRPPRFADPRSPDRPV